VAGKVTLYVRDEQLWARARAAVGQGGLSHLVQESLRAWLERSDRKTTAPTPLERARRLLAEAEQLVRDLEARPKRARGK